MKRLTLSFLTTFILTLVGNAATVYPPGGGGAGGNATNAIGLNNGNGTNTSFWGNTYVQTQVVNQITSSNFVGNGLNLSNVIHALPEYYLFTNGTLLGPNGVISTAGTVTAGIQEAINDMPLAPNSTAASKFLTPGGGTIIIQGPGRLTCTGQIIIPSYTNRPFNLTIKGVGLPQVFYNGPGGSNFVITTEYNGATLFNGLRFESDKISWLMGPNTTNCIFKLGAYQQVIFRDNVFAWNTGLTNEQAGVGGGYTYNYELKQPVQPGVVGVWLEPSSSVWSEFTGNTFYGLACGIAHFGNRGIISGNTFGSVGSFYTNGVYTYTTLWTNATYKTTSASFMGIGPAIIYKTFDVSEMVIRDNSFLSCGSGPMLLSGYFTIQNDFYYGGNYKVLAYEGSVAHVTIYRAGVPFIDSAHGDALLNDSASLPWFTYDPINTSPDFVNTFSLLNSAGNGVIVYGDLSASNNFNILGNFTYKGGSPALNSVLTSDAIGLASWRPLNTFSNISFPGTNVFDTIFVTKVVATNIFGSISPTNIDLAPGANITFTTNGHQVTIASTGGGAGTDTLWNTNTSGQLNPTYPTNKLNYAYTQSAGNPSTGPFFNFTAASTNIGNTGFFIDLFAPTASADNYGIAGQSRNRMPPNAATGLEYQNGGQIGFLGSYGTGSATRTNGDTLGLQGLNTSASSRAVAVMGTVDGRNSGAVTATTNIGGFFNVMRSGTADTNVGVYAEVRTDGGGTSASLVGSVFLGDNRNSSAPLLILRTNGVTVAEAYGNGNFSLLGASNWITGVLDLEQELRVTNSVGTTGQALTSAGPGKAPYWSTISGGGGGAPTITQTNWLINNVYTVGSAPILAFSDVVLIGPATTGAGRMAIYADQSGGSTFTVLSVVSNSVTSQQVIAVPLEGILKAGATFYWTNESVGTGATADFTLPTGYFVTLTGATGATGPTGPTIFPLNADTNVGGFGLTNVGYIKTVGTNTAVAFVATNNGAHTDIQSNSVTVTGTGTVGGTVTAGYLALSGGQSPTLTVNTTAAGAGATAVFSGPTATDSRFQVTLTPNGSPGAGAYFTNTFSAAMSNAPIAFCFPVNDNASVELGFSHAIYITCTTTNMILWYHGATTTTAKIFNFLLVQ